MKRLLLYSLIIEILIVIGCNTVSNNSAYNKSLYLYIFEDIISSPFNNKNIIYLHLKPSDSLKQGGRIFRGTLLGESIPWPDVYSDKNDKEIKNALDLYDKNDFKGAISILQPLFDYEINNQHYLLIYAKSLFFDDYYHATSFNIFQLLLSNIESNNLHQNNEILIDLWFQDLYWKLACLYLDRGEYQNAIYEISRTLYCGYDKKSKAFEQIIGYLVESYYYLNIKEINNYLFHYTKKLFPNNSYVIKYRLL